MTEFNTFDLGRIISTAEGIKAQRRQGVLDKLQEQYLGGQIQAQQDTRQNQAQQRQQQAQEMNYKRVLAGSSAVLQSDDPKGTAEALFPEFVQEFDAKHGAGSWQALDKEGVRRMAAALKDKASMQLGIAPSPKLEQIGDLNNPEKGIFQRDPVTGELKQVVAPKSDELTPYQQEMIRLERLKLARGNGPQAPPSGYRWKPDGTLEAIPGGPATVETRTGNITEGERKAAALGTRLDAALTELNGLSAIAPEAEKPGLIERGLESVGLEAAANTVRSTERQRADAAQLDALDAALTLATGAAYTKEQLQNLRKSYFPQLGDDEATVAAKKERFNTIVKTARIAAGRAEPSIDRANSLGGALSVGQSVTVGGFKVTRKQ